MPDSKHTFAAIVSAKRYQPALRSAGCVRSLSYKSSTFEWFSLNLRARLGLFVLYTSRIDLACCNSWKQEEHSKKTIQVLCLEVNCFFLLALTFRQQKGCGIQRPCNPALAERPCIPAGSTHGDQHMFPRPVSNGAQYFPRSTAQCEFRFTDSIGQIKVPAKLL